MPGQDKIESLLKEAEIYQKQGLLKQSNQKYGEILEIIEKSPGLSRDEQLVNSLKEKIEAVKEALDEVENASEIPQLSEDVQSLITNLFSFSKNKETAAIEGAVALAKFGQYEKAIAEFQKLINQGQMPLIAAKNMLRCHLNLSSPDAAVSQLQRWITRGVFPQADLKYLRDFLENLLKREGIEVDVPKVDSGPSTKGASERRMEDIFDITSIRIKMDESRFKGQAADFNVTFQLGNTVSFIIKSNEKNLLDFLNAGLRLSTIQCYSPVSLFIASGIISEKKEISSGPRKGDYSLDMEIVGPKSPSEETGK
ncbi:MAG: hypothetical protein ABII06_01530 [Pseudomonadota bacterium]